MKERSLLFALLMLCFSLVGHAENEKNKIVIFLTEQSDPTTLLREAELFANQQERRQFVVETLKRQAETAQYELLGLLNEMERNGMVADIRPLWIVNAVSCLAEPTAIRDLEQRCDVLSVSYCEQAQWIFENEATFVPRSDGREIAQNLLQVNAPQVWEQGNTGQGVVIAVIDSGVNYNHIDLEDHLWDGGEEFPHHGYDFSDNDNDPMDRHGHGTHVAGTVCGTGVSGTQTGIAPSATVMALKAFNDQGEGDEAQWIAAMQFAVEHGADVINMSLGRPQPNAAQKRMMRQACDNTLAAGVVASVCAGNIRQMQFMVPPPYNIYTPGDCPPPYLHEDQMVNAGGTSCVICVGAVNYDDNIAPFSSEGPSQWVDVPEYGDYPYSAGSATEIGLIRPDVCAPGVNIKSLDYNNISGYSELSGTSQATPCVAGIVALMLNKNPELIPAQICQILEETSVKLTPTKSNITGVGRVDALAAVNAVPAWDDVAEQNDNQAFVFPNPSKDVFTVQCEGMTRIEVLSIDGKLLKTMELSDSQCQIEGLENGVYFVRIVSENSVITHRIVKY